MAICTKSVSGCNKLKARSRGWRTFSPKTARRWLLFLSSKLEGVWPSGQVNLASHAQYQLTRPCFEQGAWGVRGLLVLLAQWSCSHFTEQVTRLGHVTRDLIFAGSTVYEPGLASVDVIDVRMQRSAIKPKVIVYCHYSFRSRLLRRVSSYEATWYGDDVSSHLTAALSPTVNR